MGNWHSAHLPVTPCSRTTLAQRRPASFDLSELLRFCFTMCWARLIFCLVQCREICHKSRYRGLALQVWFHWYILFSLDETHSVFHWNILLWLEDPSPGGPSSVSPHKVPPGCTQGRLGFLAAPTSVWRPGIWHFHQCGLWIGFGWSWLVLLGTGPSEGRWKNVKLLAHAETGSGWVYLVGPGRAVQFAWSLLLLLLHHYHHLMTRQMFQYSRALFWQTGRLPKPPQVRSQPLNVIPAPTALSNPSQPPGERPQGDSLDGWEDTLTLYDSE